MMGDVDATRVEPPPPPPPQPRTTTPIPTEEWVLNSGPNEWESYARAAASERVYGLCVLDASPKTILSYQQGAMKYIQEDLTALLPPKMAESALRMCESRGDLTNAFELRRNVVNLKKVLLHSWHAAEPLEKELRRLSTFWRYDMCFENGFVHAHRYREVCVAHMRCKGATHAAFDGRDAKGDARHHNRRASLLTTRAFYPRVRKYAGANEPTRKRLNKRAHANDSKRTFFSIIFTVFLLL